MYAKFKDRKINVVEAMNVANFREKKGVVMMGGAKGLRAVNSHSFDLFFEKHIERWGKRRRR